MVDDEWPPPNMADFMRCAASPVGPHISTFMFLLSGTTKGITRKRVNESLTGPAVQRPASPKS